MFDYQINFNLATMIKKSLFFFAVILFMIPVAKSQDCTSYFPQEKGKKLTYQMYDKKGKPSGKMYYEVLDNQRTKDGLKITTRQWVESAEGEVVDTILLNYYCKQGEFYIDMKTSLANMLGKYQGMDIKVSSKDLAMPPHLKVGDQLPDGEVTAQVLNNGVKLVTITSTVKNRKVVAKENITTPAGTFKCIKITFDNDGKVGFIKTHAQGATWYAEGIGTIRSENYNKKGKLESSSELIELK